MAFWIGILVAAAFAWFAVQIGFYESWALLFNIVVSVYVAVFAGPMIAKAVPGIGDTAYNYALSVLVAAVVSFLILHGISFVLITGQFNVPFPRIFDTLGTGFLGFLAGFLVWSFVCLFIGITPISQNSFVKQIGLAGPAQTTNMAYVCW